MATTNYDRVGKALELLREGLRPYIERELRAQYGTYWITEATAGWRNPEHVVRTIALQSGALNRDRGGPTALATLEALARRHDCPGTCVVLGAPRARPHRQSPNQLP